MRAAHVEFQIKPSRRASSQERVGLNFGMMTSALGMRDMT